MIGWALRLALLCCGIAFLCAGSLSGVPRLFPDRAATPEAAATVPVVNTLVYPTDAQGHVIVDAVVNGASVRLLVDTGASLVTLTPTDARAAGITPGELVFNHRVTTANGSARMAQVTLREIRIGQLSIYDVPAAVLEHLNVSLLGMSFLGRLQSYEMRDGKLTIVW